jgi:hypothetical protein
MSFKTLSALYSQTKCNKLAGESSTYTAPPETVGAISVVIAVALAAYSSVTIGKGFDLTEGGGGGRFWGPSTGSRQAESRTTPLVDMPQERVERYGVDGVAPNQMNLEEGAEARDVQMAGPIGYNVAAFHAAIAFAMCYIAMQMTNWNQEFSKQNFDEGVVSMWIKVIDAWILALAFGWSMIAPKVLTGREF